MKNLAELCKNKYFERFLPKNVVLMKTKNNTFLTFLNKMQFSAILCLGTCDWFCADGSQIINLCVPNNNLLHVIPIPSFFQAQQKGRN